MTNNPAEIVRICEGVRGQVVPVFRNGVDELYVMVYESFRMIKENLAELIALKNEVCGTSCAIREERPSVWRVFCYE